MYITKHNVIYIRNCLNCDYNCDGQIFISFVFPQFTSSLSSLQRYVSPLQVTITEEDSG